MDIFSLSARPMATYVVGDLQGCHAPLRRLLDRLHFDPEHDRLWFVGDLVNRGPDSLACLRFVRGLGAAAVTVLGNHDLHFCAVARGGKISRKDTFEALLRAPDRDELVDWLQQRPLLHHDEAAGCTLIHAGLPPQWDLAQARAEAQSAERALRSPDASRFLLQEMYGDEPARWSPALQGWDRVRFAVNCFTRLRFCDADGALALKLKGAPGSQPPGLHPWFAVPGRRSAGATILFGHWSALGRVHWPEHQVYGLDSGCVWGGRLTALHLERRALVAEPCEACLKPGED